MTIRPVNSFTDRYVPVQSIGHACVAAAAESARAGLVGRSAQAIAGMATTWRETSIALQHAMSSQSEAIANLVGGYAETEYNNVATVRALTDGGPPACSTNPTPPLELITACTNALRVEKTPVLPLLNADGTRPPVP